MSVGNIAKRWEQLSGKQHWKGLLNPLDMDLRQYLINYGQLAQATYDTFNSEKKSKYAGDSRYSMQTLFPKVGLTANNPFQYTPVKYLYATSKIGVPESFIMHSSAGEGWTTQSNWMGYIAVATDAGKEALGRRDIAIAWRGTIQALEWIKDFDAPLTPADDILGVEKSAYVHRGFLSIYTSDNPASQFNKSSAREQVFQGLRELVNQYDNEEISITVTGHSLGAALTTLSATDIVANGLNRSETDASKSCPVTAFAFGCPQTGDVGFKEACESMNDLHILRITNTPDIVPRVPPEIGGYIGIGKELELDTRKSMYLKPTGQFLSWHDLEIYLHGIAGTQGKDNEFRLVINRDLALLNKSSNSLKDEQLIPDNWWREKNKGMVQQTDGSWLLDDRDEYDV